MQPILTRSLTISMGIIVGLLIVDGGLAYMNTRQLREDAGWVSHTHEVLDGLDALLSSVRNAEAYERAYLYTGAPGYMESYNASKAAVERNFQRLSDLTVDNDHQQARLAELKTRIGAKFDEMEKTIVLEKKDFEAARQTVRERAGKNILDSIDGLIGEMKAEERDLLDKRELQSQRSYRIAIVAGFVTPFLGLLMIAAFVFLLRRHISDRNRAEQTIREQAAQVSQAHDELSRLMGELEKRVEQRTKELAASNRELEAFSYTISHDLRAPLRHVAGFVELLGDEMNRLELVGSRQKAEGSEAILPTTYCLPPANARRYMDNISEAAKRMGRLIDDLLMFSRIGRATISEKSISLQDMVAEAREELSSETAGRNIEWHIGSLPEVRGDAVLLRSVVVNLLSNAIKYTQQRQMARIEVGSERRDGETVCYVRDNGAGFDMKFVDKLFGVFQRLHRLEDFDGTGIGLASVQRIILRHGGRVWAEGEVDVGATFYFSLPTKKA